MADIEIQGKILALEAELCCVLTSGGETCGIREQLAVLHAAKTRADAAAAAIQAKAERAQQARLAEIADQHAAAAAVRIATRLAPLAAPPAPPSLR
jgi:hypothetical protein